MGTAVNLNGTSYTIPAVGEDNWGTQVSNYLIALATGVLTKAGGSFTLTADADFGANFGLKSIYYKSRGTTSTAGVVRLANNESVGWRNAANSADLLFKVNASNILEFNGAPIPTIALGAADEVLQMNAGGTAYEFAKINNANVAAAAAIAVDKLAALTASRAVASDASGFLTVVATTATELGYVNGVTSAIQTQLDARFLSSNVIDEDNMASNLDTKVPTQQSVKAYVDTQIASINEADEQAYDNTSSGLVAVTVQAAIDEVEARLQTEEGALTTHMSDTTTHGTTGDIVGTSDSQTLTNKTLTSPVINTQITGTAIVDEDNMVSDSAVKVPTQQSVKAYVDTHISDTTTHGTTGDIVGTSDSQTLTNKTLTSPVLDGTLSGTAFLDEDDMTSNSATKVASQQSIKAYVDAEIAGVIAAAESLHTVTNDDYTILDDDGYTIILYSTGNTDRLANLPTASANTNRRITIKKIDSGTGTVEIEGEGAETVDGATEVFLYKQYESVTLQCDGSNWFIVSAEWASGTYTPTLTNVSNTSSLTARVHQYKRVSKNRVQVCGGGTWSCTATGAFIIDADFPISSAIDNEYDAIGGGGSFSDRFYSCYISADETGNEFRIRGTCRDNGGALEGGWSFMYSIE